jgi:hypothetical protein
MADNEQQAAPKTRVNNGGGSKSYADIEKQAEKQAETQKKETAAKAAKPEKIAPKRMGFDPIRPLRLAKGFIFGTVKDTLLGISKGGRIGIYTGIAAGLLGAVGLGLGAAPALLIALPLASALGGIAVGGLIGLTTGGIKGLRREERREKYADEMAQKQETARPAGIDRRQHRAALADYRDDQQTTSNFNFDRIQQQNRENLSDDKMYWSDRVSNGSAYGRGI